MERLFVLSSPVEPLFLFKFKRNTVTRKISNSAFISQSWFISNSISIDFLIFFATFYQIIHWHYYIDAFSIIYLCTIYISYEISKWSTTFKYYLYIKSSSAVGCTENSLLTESLRMDTPISDISTY